MELKKPAIMGAALALAAMFAFQGAAQAQVSFTAEVADDLTYTRDVAPIIQQNCQVCHRPGGIGPMDLVTYDDARRYARRVREQVANRLMPPYYYDHDIGIQDLQEDWRLSDEEIATVVAWVDQGAVEGDPADMPSVELVDVEGWSLAASLGEPDLVVPSTPIDVPADGNDMWHRPIVPTGITEDRCIKALQVKPRGDAKGVVHHANSTFQAATDEGGFESTGDRATEYAMGKLGELIPDGVCRIIPADSYVGWDIHLYPGGLGAAAANDVLEDNVVELGIWLHPEDYEYEYKQDLASYGIRQGELLMKPHGTAMTQGFHTFDHPVRIDSFQPHGHVHLHGMSIQAVYPDGRTELLSMTSDFDARWHHSYIFGDDSSPLLPAGTVIVMTGWYENTADNPLTDPEAWYARGSRTIDEMSHAWIAVTHLTEDGFEKIKAEREEKARAVSEQEDGDRH